MRDLASSQRLPLVVRGPCTWNPARVPVSPRPSPRQVLQRGAIARVLWWVVEVLSVVLLLLAMPWAYGDVVQLAGARWWPHALLLSVARAPWEPGAQQNGPTYTPLDSAIEVLTNKGQFAYL
jgi:endonuclease/exonuclease/phosphatase (EEP) superfamily protein YafD